MRGENMHAVHAAEKPGGTSPRARGKLMVCAKMPFEKRNIPACAGKTDPVVASVRGRGEHPRVRGENGQPR